MGLFHFLELARYICCIFSMYNHFQFTKHPFHFWGKNHLFLKQAHLFIKNKFTLFQFPRGPRPYNDLDLNLTRLWFDKRSPLAIGFFSLFSFYISILKNFVHCLEIWSSFMIDTSNSPPY